MNVEDVRIKIERMLNLSAVPGMNFISTSDGDVCPGKIYINT